MKILVQTEEERKAYQKEYDSRPEVIARKKELAQRPEAKAKKKAARAKPENRAKQKIRDADPERKARQKERDALRRGKPEYKVWQKNYYLKNAEKIKTKKKIRDAKPENKAKIKEYANRPDVKARTKIRKASPAYKKKMKDYRTKQRLIVLKKYSKDLSHSSIPCCNCCGINSHIGFLAIDHISGKRQMDSESELLELKYRSNMNPDTLINWLIRNDFPKGFQILCHSCNVAKRDYGNCPLEGKPH